MSVALVLPTQLRYLLLQLLATLWQDAVRVGEHVVAVMLHCGMFADVAMRGDPLESQDLRGESPRQ